MRRVQSISSGKANTHASWGGLRWIKPAGYAPHLRARKWMGELVVSYEVGKGSKMALDHAAATCGQTMHIVVMTEGSVQSNAIKSF